MAAPRGAPISVDEGSELPANVSLGEGCLFEHTRATFAHFRSGRDPGLRLGARAQVFEGTTFAVEADGVVDIGEGSVLAGAVFMCAEAITLGRGVVASYNVTVTDCDFHPLNPGQRRRDAIAVAPEGDRSRRAPLVTAPVVVDDEAWIGIGAIILKGVRIGKGARVGAGAVVARDVPPDATVVGNPARPLEPSRRE